MIGSSPSRESAPQSVAEPTDEASTQQLSDLFDAHGALHDDVWTTAFLYHKHPEAQGNFAAVARMLKVKTSTVTRRYDKLVQLVVDVAESKVPNHLLALHEDSKEAQVAAGSDAPYEVEQQAVTGEYAEAAR